MTHKNAYPIAAPNTDTDVVKPQLDLDTLRLLIAQAPVHSADSPKKAAAGLRSYQYGCWPATTTEAGLIIAEETVPRQEVLDEKGEIEYFKGESFAISKFMPANLLTRRLTGNVGDALKSLGYNATQHATDSRGSQMIALQLPSFASLNTQLGTNITLTSKNTDADEVAELKAYAEHGEIAVNGEHDMMLVAPIAGLLAPAVHNALRAKVLAALTSAESQNIAEAKRSFNSLLLNIFGGPIEVATSPNAQQQDIDNLGYKLSMLVSPKGTEPADEGRSLAEQTVRHIYELGSI